MATGNDGDLRVAAASLSNLPSWYVGEETRTLDLGRVLLLTNWRGEGRPTDFIIMLMPMDKPAYLLVVPQVLWEQLAIKREPSGLFNDRERRAGRVIGKRSISQSLDKAGRLLLPEEAGHIFKADKQVVLLGCTHSFEIWPVDGYKDPIAETDWAQFQKYLEEKNL
jgi:DNA-binding transcriptional regulator/RsmH inhibitor MraZ